MKEAPIVYKFDEDGYFIRAKYAQESPSVKGKFLIPKRSTQIKPEIPEGYVARWNDEVWEYEKLPTSAADFIGKRISHKSQTEHSRLMRKLLQDFVKADSDHYRVIRGSQEEGLYWSVEKIPEKTQDELDLEEAKQQEQQLLQKLRDTDYVAAKLAEGVATKEEYEEVLSNRAEWREQINGLRATQQALAAKIAESSGDAQ